MTADLHRGGYDGPRYDGPRYEGSFLPTASVPEQGGRPPLEYRPEPAIDPLEAHTRRRLAAEAAADAAEAQAAATAERAAAAIRAAAMAADEAEAAAAAAAAAADEAADALDAEHAARTQRLTIVPPLAPAAVRATPQPTARPTPDTVASTAVIPPVEARPANGHHRHAAQPDDDSRTDDQPREGDVELTMVAPLRPRHGQPDPAARQRAQEVAAAAHREASRDPITEVFPVDRSTDVERTTIVNDVRGDVRDRRRGSDITALVDMTDDPLAERHGDAGAYVEPHEDEPRRPFLRRPLVLAGISLVAVLAVVGALFALLNRSPATVAPTAATQAGTGSSASAAPLAAETVGGGLVSGSTADPSSDKATAFLGAMRRANIPTSRSGVSESQAAAGVCQQLSQGADEASLAKQLPSVLPTISRKQSPDFVDLAQKYYC